MPAAHPDRHNRLDALRGLAMLWMTGYHFCFDLNYFGYIRQDFYQNPVWIWQRSAIVSLFLLCAGIGQALAVRQGQGWPRFWRRWAQVAGGAALVTAASLFVFPESYIYFGVLHGLAVMLIAARVLLVRRVPRAALLIGGGALIALTWIAPAVLSAWVGPEISGLFNSRALNWLGLITRKPYTEDYVPLAPWLGVLLWGAAAGRWRWLSGALAHGGGGRAVGALALLGRWSLSYYLLHQPVLIGALWLIKHV